MKIHTLNRASSSRIEVQAGGTVIYLNGVARCVSRSEDEGIISAVLMSDVTRPTLVQIEVSDAKSVALLDTIPFTRDDDKATQAYRDHDRSLTAVAARTAAVGFPEPEAGWLRLSEGMVTLVVGARRWDLRQAGADLPFIESVDLADGESCVVKIVHLAERLSVRVTGHMVDVSLVAARWLETREQTDKRVSHRRWEYRIISATRVTGCRRPRTRS